MLHRAIKGQITCHNQVDEVLVVIARMGNLLVIMLL